MLFDWDSTLCSIEGIDALARDLAPAPRQQVEQATAEAMSGQRSLESVYRTRLDAVAPDRSRLAALAENYQAHLLPDAAAVVAALHAAGKQVGVVSGGLRAAILPVSRCMGIEDSQVHAVEVHLNEDGSYRGLDEGGPLWRSGGKLEVLRSLPAELHPMGFVGDGATDLEVAEEVACFVGFGGVVRRPQVERAAPLYLIEARLAPLLHWLLTPDERTRLQQDPRFAELLSGPPPKPRPDPDAGREDPRSPR